VPDLMGRLGQLAVVPGRQVWRIVIDGRETDRTEVLRSAAQATAELLYWAQPGVLHPWYWYGNDKPFAIVSGYANPINPVEAKRSDPMRVPVGELLGTRTPPLVVPDGFPPLPPLVTVRGGEARAWWVWVDLWWRGERVDLETWPRTRNDWAVLDLAATAPSTVVHEDPGGRTAAEVLEREAGEIIETTGEDIDKAIKRLPSIGASAFAGGVLAVILALLWSHRR